MNKYKQIAVTAILVLLSIAAPPLQAQDGDESSDETKDKKAIQVYEVEVTEQAKRDEVETPNMTVLWPEFFPLGIGTSLDMVLERQAGIDVQRIQQIGTAIDDDSIKLRGFGARRIVVARDGRPVNTSGVAGGYFIDWTQIPLNNVERIEIVKGVSDPRYGNTLGGMVNLVRKRPSEEMETDVQVSLSEHATTGVNLFHSWKPGRFEYSFAGGTTDSDGYLRNGNYNLRTSDIYLGYDLMPGTRVSTDISYSRLKKNFIVPNRVSGDPSDPDYDTPIDSDYPASDGEYMYGGMGAYPEEGSWWIKEKWQVDVGVEHRIGRSGMLKVGGWKNHGDREAYNTRAGMGRVFHKTFYDDRSYGFRGSLEYNLQGHTLRVGSDYSYLKDDGDTNHADDFRASFRNGFYVASKTTSVFLMDDVSLLDGRLLLTPGVRYTSFEGVSGPAGLLELIPDIGMSAWAPSLKITWLGDGDNLLFASVAGAARMPTGPEHYWHFDADDAGVDTSGLPFEHEDGIIIQGGWRGTPVEDTHLEITPYYYDISNYIQFDLVNFISYNIDKAKIWGVEFEVTRKFGERWQAFFNYAYQKSNTEGDQLVENFVRAEDSGFDEVPGLPEHKFNAGVMCRALERLKVSVFLRAVSEQEIFYGCNELWNTGLQVLTQDGCVTSDLEARLDLAENYELSFFARNLFDATYCERYGYPAAGRLVGVAFSSKF